MVSQLAWSMQKKFDTDTQLTRRSKWRCPIPPCRWPWCSTCKNSPPASCTAGRWRSGANVRPPTRPRPSPVLRRARRRRYCHRGSTARREDHSSRSPTTAAPIRSERPPPPVHAENRKPCARRGTGGRNKKEYCTAGGITTLPDSACS